VNLPVLADAVVSDQMGFFGFEAGLIQGLQDARKRFLKPGGVLIPTQLDLYAAPIEWAELWSDIDFWNRRDAGFDLRPGFDVASNTSHPFLVQPSHLLGPAEKLISIDLATFEGDRFSAEAELRIDRAGVLHGVAGWFSARLSENVWLTNSPQSDRRMARKNAVLPIGTPESVHAGDRIRFRILIDLMNSVASWKFSGESSRRSGKDPFEHRHGTHEGTLITKAQLNRSGANYVPSLSPTGDATLMVLRMCSQSRPLHEIEESLAGSFPGLFATLAHASRFMGTILSQGGLLHDPPAAS